MKTTTTTTTENNKRNHAFISFIYYKLYDRQKNKHNINRWAGGGGGARQRLMESSVRLKYQSRNE